MGIDGPSQLVLGVQIFLLIAFTASILAMTYGMVCMYWFFYKRVPAPLDLSQEQPGLTVIKPCYDQKDNEAVNLEVFFHQDYPGPYQLIFVVSDKTDPIVPLIQSFLKKYPNHDAQLVVSSTRKAYWKKIDALYDAHKAAKYDYVIWSDSDVIVRKNYLSLMSSSLQEKGVSVVTTPQYDTHANTFPSALKALGNNCDIAIGVMTAVVFRPLQRLGWGHSLGFNRREFDEFGPYAWDYLNRFLADDQGLPRLFNKFGKKIVYRNIYCPVEYSNKSLKDVLQQKIRWLLPQRVAVGSRLLHFLSTFLYPVITALFLVLWTNFSTWSLWLLGIAALLRILCSFQFELLYLRDLRTFVRFFWAVPIWDFLHIGFNLIALFKDSMEFGGKTYRVVDQYFLEEETHPHPLFRGLL